MQAEAITYEVSDNTPRDIIKKRGNKAAKLLMRIMLKDI
jgi:hypothetical protein